MPKTPDTGNISANLGFASASCTRHPCALSTLPSHHLAAYISQNNVFVLSTPDYRVCAVRALGTAPLNALQLCVHRGQSYILAASSDGMLFVCAVHLRPPHVLSLLAAHALHGDACLALHVVALGMPEALCVASVNATEVAVSLVRTDGAEVATVDPVARLALATSPHASPFLPHAVALHVMAPGVVVLAVAGTDRRIHLFRASADGPLALLTRIPAHRDWIRSIAFAANAAGEPILASASSDSTVRLFRLHKPLPDDPPQPLHLQFELEGHHWSVQSLAMLDEHTATVHTVAFSKPSGDSPVHMLTASLDGTLSVWALADGRPVCTARFGLLGGHAVHGRGFYSAVFSISPTSTTVLAANYSGAIHRWVSRDEFSSFTSLPAVGGHFAPISHVVWAPDSSFILSASLDKTVRVFADATDCFVEWGRPQVHGHSVFSVGFCSSNGARYVSGAEERMLRVFDAPESFRLPGAETNINGKETHSSTALAATLPELGLSNKAVFKSTPVSSGGSGNGNANDEDDSDSEERVDDMLTVAIGSARGDDATPLEEELKQRTLWPETAKLYGHGNELVRISTDRGSDSIASACRSQTAKDAVVIVWDGTTGTERARLPAHDLSVTDLRFSNDGRKLLSVSRDRSFAVFKREVTSGDGRFDFQLITRVETAHSRIIYGCTWITEDVLATGGRDKWLKLFSIASCENTETALGAGKRKFEAGVTALDCVSLEGRDEQAIAVGLENGDFYIILAKVGVAPQWDLSVAFQAGESMRCGGRITSLQWRPTGDGTRVQSSAKKDLAVGSDDQSVRVISFDFNINVTRQPS